jgi:hypothetical protein
MEREEINFITTKIKIMNQESHQMKKRIQDLKEKGGKLFENEKKTSQPKVNNKKNKWSYKNLWPPSEKTKKQEDTSEGFKFGDVLPLFNDKKSK